MNKGLSLYFAVMGTLLLVAFAGSLSFRNAGVSIALFVITILHIGIGFMIRARLRRKS
jgi:hypothetical protein